MGLPTPFQRPSVNLGSPKKDWKVVPVHSVRIGDMVRDLGLVTDMWDAPQGVVLVFKSGDQHSYEEGETLLAFVTV